MLPDVRIVKIKEEKVNFCVATQVSLNKFQYLYLCSERELCVMWVKILYRCMRERFVYCVWNKKFSVHFLTSSIRWSTFRLWKCQRIQVKPELLGFILLCNEISASFWEISTKNLIRISMSVAWMLCYV